MQHENNYILFHLFIHFFFGVACNIFRIVFAASLIKNIKFSTVKFSRRMQCSNVALHTHENVASWPQGFIFILMYAETRRVQAVALMFFQMKKYKFDLLEENLKMMVQR